MVAEPVFIMPSPSRLSSALQQAAPSAFKSKLEEAIAASQSSSYMPWADSDSDEETAWCFRCNTTFPIDRDGGDWGVHEEWVCDRCLPTCVKCGKQLWQASDECCGEGRTDGVGC